VEPNRDCKYIIDDVVFDEQQMLEMFGLIAMNGYPSWIPFRKQKMAKRCAGLYY
jgi:hypothetical protein